MASGNIGGGGARRVVVDVLAGLGLLQPAFRCWERVRALGSTVSAFGPDGLPLPGPLLMVRVAGTADADWFLDSGRLAAQSIRTAVERAGTRFESLDDILDFGCGCGRVLRHWNGLRARICGSDLSRPAIEWCRNQLPFDEMTVNGLEPPLSYTDQSFDLVYALSVFTHLSVETQFAWLGELRRVLRPSGYLVLSVHGEAYAERLKPEEAQLFAQGQCVVRRVEAAGSNLCSSFHPPAFIHDRLAQNWELVEHLPRGALGNPEQDLIVLRKPGP